MDKQLRLYVNGEFRDPVPGEWFPSTNPYTGEEVLQVPRGMADDVDDAVAAAHEAVFDGPWSDLMPTEWGRHLNELADVLEERAEEHTKLEVRENGIEGTKEFLATKTVWLATEDGGEN